MFFIFFNSLLILSEFYPFPGVFLLIKFTETVENALISKGYLLPSP
jgi:hypothetical protein